MAQNAQTLAWIAGLGEVAERLFSRSYRIIGKGDHPPQETPVPPSKPADLIRRAHRLEAIVQAKERENTRLHAIFASVREGIVVQDMQGRIIMMNDAAREMLGSQKAFWQSVFGRMFHEHREMQRIEGEIVPLDKAVRAEVNNRIVVGQIAAVATETGERIGSVVVLRDVTDEMVTERLKDEFIKQMSHELRTPLTAIKGMSDVLLNQPQDRPPNRTFLEVIGRNAATLDKMIVELLDISEIGAGGLVLHKEDLRIDDVVWDVVEGMKRDFERAEIEIHVMTLHPDIHVDGDRRRLKWALGHLLDNAIKYTLPGGQVVIAVGRLMGRRTIIEISDTGVGISEEDLPQIFDRFYRGKPSTPDGRVLDPRGLGQGLFVARAVAEAHGGGVSVASVRGQGSTFTFSMPLSEKEAGDHLAITETHQPITVDKDDLNKADLAEHLAPTRPHRPIRLTDEDDTQPNDSTGVVSA
jgi:two-component system sensor histidine kinase ResE